ncbi:hypothetical protein SAMN05192534_1612 [Alteribacillus persepolensis]|uniref:Uncharacterized protein n=1 Tax=Alteribacillus persepolensis TaxID=568899 RepID=A0A1G8KPW5_9BACI|nr:hypothetical protein [Alteribacillus persepolensis]SDI45458.1 hypothetical protein SAMN05192534_1612 [Alteribacillus persepolensis]
MKQGIIFAVICLTLLLTACNDATQMNEEEPVSESDSGDSVEKDNSNESVLALKDISEIEEHYANLGVDNVAIYDVKKVPRDAVTLELMVNAYEDGKRVDEYERGVVGIGLREKHREELDELAITLTKNPSKTEDTTYRLDLAQVFDRNKEGNGDSSTYVDTSVSTTPILEIPFQNEESVVTSIQPSAPVELGETSWLIVQHSGSSTTNNINSERNLEELINDEERVMVIGVHWSEKSITELADE